MTTRRKGVQDPLNAEGLTDQESWFCDEYILDFSGKYAAIRVGVDPAKASHWATIARRNPAVMAGIERRIAKKRQEAQALRDTVLNELLAIATSRHQHYTVDDFGRVTLNGAPLEDDAKGDRAHAAVKRVKRRTHYERDPDNDDPNAVRAVHEVEYELWDKNTALRNLGVHLGMFIERTAAAKDGESPEGDKTVWEFGGKKFAF